MPTLQLVNVGSAPIIVKDPSGYSDLVVEVAAGTTVTVDVSHNQLQYLTPLLKELEGEDPSDALIKLRWSVLASSALDDRAEEYGLAGLPNLVELRAANYSTGSGATDVVATGTAMLGGQTKASLQVFVGTARLDLTAVTPGGAGNAISCVIATPSSTLDVSVSGSKITVRPASGGSTVAAIVSAINASPTALLLVQATAGVGGTFDAAVAEQFLTGGKGPGVSLTLGGTACTISELTDTSCTFSAPSGISANGRIVALELRNGPQTSRLSVPVAA